MKTEGRERPWTIVFATAVEADATEIAILQAWAATDLTLRHGRGHWTCCPKEKAVLRGIKSSRVLVARREGRIVGVLRLATKKPWAIDPTYFSDAERPLYLLDMAVDPDMQRRGIGRQLFAHAVAIARAWPADAIRLDAYDSKAGAEGFYAKCGLREVGRVTYRGVPLIYFELRLL